MSSTSSSVTSGVAYPVTSVAGRDAVVLAQFLAETGFTVDVDGTPCMVSGWGTLAEQHVCFREKDDLDQDVRVWRVTPVGSGFAAESVEAD